ncbi:MAG: tail fiber domain-containing protein [Xanthomonadales bacterium]|nr:tail fiber domain-containing protein [Xanthomonadales bacterium]
MKKLHLIPFSIATAFLAAIVLGPMAQVPANAQQAPRLELADVQVGAEFIDIQIPAVFEAATLRISGPDGYALTLHLPGAGSTITADLLFDAAPVDLRQQPDHGALQLRDRLPDGIYTYELETFAKDGTQDRVSGQFRVEGGAAIQKAPAAQVDTDEGVTQEAEPGVVQRLAGAVLDFLVPSAQADSFSRVCVNDGCAEPESYPIIDGWFAPLKLKRNAPSRILFENTNAGWVDWALIANAGPGSAPENYFAIKNVDLDRDPFRIDGNAPADSIRVLDSGNVGLGTAAPQGKLHIRTAGNIFSFPPSDIRLTNSFFNVITGITSVREFRINHSTTGLWFHDNADNPFVKFNHGAPANSLVVASNGVGIGTDSPQAPLHVRRTDGTAEILLEETQAIDLNPMLTMSSNGNSGFGFDNTRDGSLWQFRTGGPSGTADAFLISLVGTGKSELNLNKNGNLTVAGTVFTGSSKEIKTNIVDVEVESHMDRLLKMPIRQWAYRTSPNQTHIGPMAEDFNEIFGYGGRPTQIAPSDLASLSLLASQELLKRNQELESRIHELEKRLTIH